MNDNYEKKKLFMSVPELRGNTGGDTFENTVFEETIDLRNCRSD